MAEGNGLLNRRRGKTSTEGSNPSLSATILNQLFIEEPRIGPRGREQVAPASGVVERGADDPPLDQLAQHLPGLWDVSA